MKNNFEGGLFVRLGTCRAFNLGIRHALTGVSPADEDPIEWLVKMTVDSENVTSKGFIGGNRTFITLASEVRHHGFFHVRDERFAHDVSVPGTLYKVPYKVPGTNDDIVVFFFVTFSPQSLFISGPSSLARCRSIRTKCRAAIASA